MQQQEQDEQQAQGAAGAGAGAAAPLGMGRPTDPGLSSGCLYLEEALLRNVRKLKGRKLLRANVSLASAQEAPIASECCFDVGTSVRLLHRINLASGAARAVRDMKVAEIKTWDGENAAYWVVAPQG